MERNVRFYIGATAWNAISGHTIEGCWMQGLAEVFGGDTQARSDAAPDDNRPADRPTGEV